ncbi:MAG: helix-hairpin-helix domain-containing protein [Actinobacteria bacterium]|nr:helix-hairpin-helix domain-containing protein [Actinomycetota bacterium]
MDREKLRLAGYGVAAVLVVVLGARMLGGGDAGGGSSGLMVDAGPTAAHPPPAAGGARGAGMGGGSALVQVAGEVNRPGVYRVPAGARVSDAVQKAGGLTSNAEQAGINLVARVQDGQQVIVPRKGAGPAPVAGGATAAAGGTGGASGSGPVSLSSATAAQLEALDGIGPTLAQRIVAYRQAHGGFRSIDELRQVQGIGEKRFEMLRKSITP